MVNAVGAKRSYAKLLYCALQHYLIAIWHKWATDSAFSNGQFVEPAANRQDSMVELVSLVDMYNAFKNGVTWLNFTDSTEPDEIAFWAFVVSGHGLRRYKGVDYVLLIMEYAQGGSLERFIETLRKQG